MPHSTPMQIDESVVTPLRITYAVVALAVVFTAFIIGLSWKADTALTIGKENTEAIGKLNDRSGERFPIIISRLSVLESESKMHGDDLKDIKSMLREIRQNSRSH